jgi:hypothetical protein
MLNWSNNLRYCPLKAAFFSSRQFTTSLFINLVDTVFLKFKKLCAGVVFCSVQMEALARAKKKFLVSFTAFDINQ